MKYLILVDVQFPYSTGETFLENEIQEIAPWYDRILIFPADLVAGEKQTRSIPDNVRACLFETENPIFRKAKAALRALPRVPANRGSLKERFWDAYFAAAARDQAKKILRILEEYTFSPEDAVTLYSYWLYIPARIVVELKHWFLGKGVPVRAVSRAHGFDIHEKYSGKGYLPQRQLLLRELDRVYACSQDGAACLRRKFPGFADKVGVSVLGTYDHGIGRESRRPFQIVSCSRLVELKRVDMIADAVVRLVSQGYDVCWTHLGDGDQMQKVRARVPEEMKDRLHLPGAIPNSEVYAFYRANAVDLFVNASTSEGLPVSIMEAISYGVPVVATDVGGTREIVVDGVTGTLVSPDITAEGLADAIAAYCHAAPEEIARLRFSARQFWEEHFDAKANYRKFVEEIEGIELRRD